MATPQKTSKVLDAAFGVVVNSVVPFYRAHASVTKDGLRCEVCGHCRVGKKRVRVWIYTFRLSRDGPKYAAMGAALAKRVCEEGLTKEQAVALVK